MKIYYNENDPKPAAWLRELMAHDLIPQGDVDERSILDVKATDLMGYTSCHFFAGIGGWPFALRLAGWPDSRPVWTGSCPCQPFSVAGKGLGEKDDRHLWPAFRDLIRDVTAQRSENIPAIFGEQVASKTGRDWLARVRTDLEELGYDFGAADLCSAGVGAPHIRQRLHWVAYAHDIRRDEQRRAQTSEIQRKCPERGGQHSQSGNERKLPGRFEGLGSGVGGVANVQQQGLEGQPGHGDDRDQSGRIGAQPAGSIAPGGGVSGDGVEITGSQSTGRRVFRPDESPGENPERTSNQSGGSGSAGRVAEPDGRDASPEWEQRGREQRGREQRGREQRQQPQDGGIGFWSDFDLVHCLDGKTRRTGCLESDFLLLADGFWYNLADVYSEIVAQAVAESKNYATKARPSSEESLQMVSDALNSTEVLGAFGGQGTLPSETILQYFMRDIFSAFNRTSDGSGSPETGDEDDRRMLRDLRLAVSSELSPLRRESLEQCHPESSDSLRALSWFLARCLQTCRGLSSRAYATNFPTAGKVKGRTTMLRGIGNAVNPRLAAEFILACEEARKEIDQQVTL